MACKASVVADPYTYSEALYTQSTFHSSDTEPAAQVRRGLHAARPLPGEYLQVHLYWR